MLKPMTKSMSTAAYKHLRALLVQARQIAGFTQRELAVKLGRPQSYISKYECGERRIDLVEFLEIACVLDIDVADCIQTLQEMHRREADADSLPGF